MVVIVCTHFDCILLPCHVFSARGGHVEAIKLLVKHGADVNAKTFGDGGTALYLAKQAHGAEHPVIDFLESIGALEAGPEL